MEIGNIAGGYGQRLEEISLKRTSGAAFAGFKQNNMATSAAANPDFSVQDEKLFSKESLSYLSDQEISFFNNQASAAAQYSKYGKCIGQMNVHSSLNIHI